MPYRVHATGHARRQIEAAGDWWLAHRDKAPELFVDELETAQALLSGDPHVGTAFQTPRHPGARRLLMHKTRYHLYYTVHDEHELYILAQPPSPRQRHGCGDGSGGGLGEDVRRRGTSPFLVAAGVGG